MAEKSPRTKRPKEKDTGADKPQAKKTKVEDSAAELAASDVTAPVHDRMDEALTVRTSEEDRAALEKTVDMLIGEGYPVQVPDEGTPVDRPPPELGTLPEEFSSEWKEEQDLLRKKDEEERAERKKVRN